MNDRMYRVKVLSLACERRIEIGARVVPPLAREHTVASQAADGVPQPWAVPVWLVVDEYI
jgi:hypothetical protein